MTDTIGVLGCGWLGLPLAKAFKKKGYTVKGTTTSDEKLKALTTHGIEGYKVILTENGISGALDEFISGVSILIINVPPKLRRSSQGSFYEKMRLLSVALTNASSIKKVLFVSSTSVYGNVGGEISESTEPKPVTDSGTQLLASERLFQNLLGIETTIIRFGGLIGPDRHPVNQLAGRVLRNGDDLVNLIHLNDCIAMVMTVIEKGYWGTLFNGVYPHHPTKREYYTNEAEKRNLPLPKYLEAETLSSKKRIKSKNKLINYGVLSTSIVS